MLTVALAPISYGPMQVRVSEAMTLLAFVNPRFLPGLVIGCLAANAASPLAQLTWWQEQAPHSWDSGP